MESSRLNYCSPYKSVRYKLLIIIKHLQKKRERTEEKDEDPLMKLQKEHLSMLMDDTGMKRLVLSPKDTKQLQGHL